MNCPHCKKKIASSSAFCSHCGRALERRSPGAAPASKSAAGSWDAVYEAASQAYARQAFPEAAEHFRKLLQMKPQLKGHALSAAFGGDEKRLMASANLYLGLALKEMGDPVAACLHLEEAGRLDQTSPLAFGVLGELYMAHEEFGKAATAYRGALERVSDPASQLALHNDLGVACFRAGDLKQAMEEFKWVIHRDQKNQNAIYNLGVLYLKEGMQEGLQREWKEFLKADDAAGILFGLTRSMVEAAQTEKASPEPVGLVGGSAPMRQVLDLIKRASASTANVLILGENGTGKELVARAIHTASPRSRKAFVAIHCGALPEGLLESELFGYEKGAFTGAYAAKPGRFELAEGGTLFFDEIGDLNLSLQVKLLRVIQERSFERLGGTKTLHADVRLMAATHRDLKQMVAAGTFREDLFYRLYVIALTIPPLRERREDIPQLAQYFLDRFNLRSRKHFTGLHPEALARLAAHDWPGNVRELENIMERAVALYDDSLILPAYLQFNQFEVLDPLKSALPTAPAEPPARMEPSLAQAEKRQILESLRESHYRVPRAAKALGISRVTLYRKMQKYDIDPKQLMN